MSVRRSPPCGGIRRTGQAWARTAAVASLRAARASAALDGAPLRMDPDALVVTEPLVAGALRVASSIGAMATVWPRSPLQMLARLHTLAAADLVRADQLGRPRTTDPTVGPGLAELVEPVTTSPWPAPVQVAVVHARLMTLRPFHHANGVIARAAARLTMMSTGLDPAGLGVPEVAHLRDPRRYGSSGAGVADGRPDAEHRLGPGGVPLPYLRRPRGRVDRRFHRDESVEAIPPIRRTQ